MNVARMRLSNNDVQLTSYAVKSGVVVEDSEQAAAAELETEPAKVALGRDTLDNMTVEMNKFMQMANSDIQFKLHEGTKQLIVQVIDTKDQTVIKEFPPHEMLDMVAKIREYVGMLLDKRA